MSKIYRVEPGSYPPGHNDYGTILGMYVSADSRDEAIEFANDYDETPNNFWLHHGIAEECTTIDIPEHYEWIRDDHVLHTF